MDLVTWRSSRPPAIEQQQWKRLTDIESLASWATSLLTIVRQDTMKAGLRLILLGLEERHLLLLEHNAGEGPTVDLTNTLARSRLKVIADACETAGLIPAMRRPPLRHW